MKKKAAHGAVRNTASIVPAKQVALSSPIRGHSFLEVTQHAELRMAERGVTLPEVLQTLLQPGTVNLRADPPYKRISKMFGARRTVNVVFWNQLTKLTLITAWVS